MRFLVPTTIEGVRKQKQRFMFRWVTETNRKQKEVYEQAVNGCDRLTARIIEKGKRKLGLMLILLCLCLLQGCQAAKATLNLGGAICEDIAWMAEKTADNINPKE